MHDVARPHRTADVLDFLSEHFDDRVIAMHYWQHIGTEMDLPHHSPDLTPCVLFSLVYPHDQIYHQNPQMIEKLR